MLSPRSNAERSETLLEVNRQLQETSTQQILKKSQKHGYTAVLLRIRRRNERLGVGLNDLNRVTEVGPAVAEGLRMWDWVIAFDGVAVNAGRIENLIGTMPKLPIHELVVLRPQGLAFTSEALEHSMLEAGRMAVSPQLSARMLVETKEEQREIRRRSLALGELQYLPHLQHLPHLRHLPLSQLEELEITEATYVRDLDHLVSRFLTPLRCCRLLPKVGPGVSQLIPM